MDSISEQAINDLILKTANSLGLEVVKISFEGIGVKTLEILIERLDNKPVSISDCQSLSKNLSPVLDVENVIHNKYILQVSSAGLERPLTKIADYNRFVGREVKIRLKEKLNNSISYNGQIVTIDQYNNIILESNGMNLAIPFRIIKSANLVVTDELFKKLLNKQIEL